MMRKYKGDTFVCFIDISGFKKAMLNDLENAGRMLDVFYSAGYRALLTRKKTLKGIFVSDCGIIYSVEGTPDEKLSIMLQAIKEINIRMLENNYLTVASIAYGSFEYKSKIAFKGLQKSAFYGNGYLNAFKDTEVRDPNKLYAGEVRIVKVTPDKPPTQVSNIISHNHPTFQFLRDKNEHFYYHWYPSKSVDFDRIDDIYQPFLASDRQDIDYEFLIQRIRDLKF